MRKTFLFLLLLLTIFATAQALSILPKNALLQAGDNQREVKYLQEILNSDPETMISTEGIGSPGKENWFFGQLTEQALKTFQAKYSLEVTGKVDVKTLQILNSVAISGPATTGEQKQNNDQSATEDTYNNNSEENIYLDNNSDNPYIVNEDSEKIGETKKDETETSKDKAVGKTTNSKPKTEESRATPTKTYLDSILEKYTSLINTNTSPTTPPTNQPTDKFSNTYSPETPYYNPNTGVYSNNPNNATQSAIPTNPNQTNPYLNPYLNQGLSPFGGGSSPFSSASGANSGGLFGNGGIFSGLQRMISGQTSATTPSGNPTVMGPSSYNLTAGGELNANKFKILGDNWLIAYKTTDFGTKCGGGADPSYAGRGAAWDLAAMSSLSKNGPVNTADPATCIVALPIEVQVYYWGDEQQKKMYPTAIRGLSTTAQLRALGGMSFYRKVAGTPIEVVNLANGKCTVAPVWETGPGEKEGGSIDLTPCVKLAIGNCTNFQTRFRPVPKGKEGCEGYQKVDTLIKKIK